MSPTPPNATRTDIVERLKDGYSNTRIARDLRVDKHRVRRIRDELGLPAFVRVEQTRTIEEKWALFTRPTEGGHLEWTGTRGTSAGTPVLSYKEQLYTAAAIAFTIKNGREPQGYVKADCGMQHCVAPGHVEDAAGRRAKRAELRQIAGMPEQPSVCPNDHDQAEHGRLGPDGGAYCHACMMDRKRRPPKRPKPEREATLRLVEDLLRQDVPAVRIAQQLQVSGHTVRKVRAAIGLPSPGPGKRIGYPTPDAAFVAQTKQLEDGHQIWAGTGKYVCFRQERIAPSTIAFRLHNGRPPVGPVRINCGLKGCVAGGHLEDRQIRDANRRADTAFEVIFGGAG